MNNKQFLIIGDNLAIDFINTQIVEDGKPKDLLTNFEDFVLWQKAIGLIDQPEVERLTKKWARHETHKVFRDVWDFRKTLRDAVESIAAGKPIKTSAIQQLNEILRRQKYGYYQVVKTRNEFASKMHEQYLNDLQNTTEIVLNPRRRVRPIAPRKRTRGANRGSAGRVAAGAIRIGNTVGAAITNSRALGPAEAHVMLMAGIALGVLAVFTFLWAELIAIPLSIIGVWIAITLLYKSWQLKRKQRSADIPDD